MMRQQYGRRLFFDDRFLAGQPVPAEEFAARFLTGELL